MLVYVWTPHAGDINKVTLGSCSLPHAEMEKGSDNSDTASANFSQLCSFLVFAGGFLMFFVCVIFGVFAQLCWFCTILSNFCTYFVCKIFRHEVVPLLFCKLFPSLGKFGVLPEQQRSAGRICGSFFL